MSAVMLENALDYMAAVATETKTSKVGITFHGGEPLMASHEYWHAALRGLDARFGKENCRISLQSNLWRLDGTLCDLFRKFNVEIGTSLDGPEAITDSQRGQGYFQRTVAGIHRAREHGLEVGCIATFTPRAVSKWREIFDFFLSKHLGFSIHPAVRPLGGSNSFVISPEDYTRLHRELLAAYIENRRDITVSSLDQICQSVATGEGKVCTFRDCLGMFLAIDPDGGIYPCQRLAGKAKYRLGHLEERPSLSMLLHSPVAINFASREERVRKDCAVCPHLLYCKGGCPYNAWAEGGPHQVRDPYCQTYQNLFGHIHDRLMEEMSAEENIEAITQNTVPDRGHPLLRKGPLIEIACGGAHPSQKARTARRIVAAVELARGPDIPTVAARLYDIGIGDSLAVCEAALRRMDAQLHPTKTRLHKLYLHVTFRCQLSCTHCYASADASGHSQEDMSVPAVLNLIEQAVGAGFSEVILTGGEPLVHQSRDALLNALARLRKFVKPMILVLRTNLAMPLNDADLTRIAHAVDRVTISVDGSETTHDARRSMGSYIAMRHNLKRYLRLAAEISNASTPALACSMASADIKGPPGHAVRRLAAELGIRHTGFRPLLPLGRAAKWKEPPAPEALEAHKDPMELIENGFYPTATCGIGQNLYVEPSGEAFPCYAYHKPHALLGSANVQGIQAILDSQRFQDLACHTVDTNPKCRTCELRYLCGGACRAWGGEATQHNLDAPPLECDRLRQRALELLQTAMKYLELKQDNFYIMKA